MKIGMKLWCMDGAMRKRKLMLIVQRNLVQNKGNVSAKIMVQPLGLVNEIFI